MPGRAEWLIKALHETANEIGDLFDVRASDARRHPQADEWSILEVVAHLRDRETIAASHLEQLLLSAGSRLRLHEQEWCDPDPQPARNLGQALYAFGAQRRRTVSLLWAMGPEAWERGAQHPYRGWVDGARDRHRPARARPGASLAGAPPARGAAPPEGERSRPLSRPLILSLSKESGPVASRTEVSKGPRPTSSRAARAPVGSRRRIAPGSGSDRPRRTPPAPRR